MPRLAQYDVDIDAGSDASDPENAVSFSLELPNGETLKQPGQPVLRHRDVAVRDQPRLPRQGRPGDVDGDGKVEFGEGLPDADIYVAAVSEFDEQAKTLDADAQAFEPTPSDAFTAITVMTPTMSEYFEAWKNSRFIAGEDATELGFVAASRLSDIADILEGLVLTYDEIEPLIAAENPQQAEQTEQALRDLLAYVEDLRDQEADGKKFTAEEADTLGAEAQRQAEAIAGQVTQAAQQLESSCRRPRCIRRALGQVSGLRAVAAVAVGSRLPPAPARAAAAVAARPSRSAPACSRRRRRCCSTTAPSAARGVARRGRALSGTLARELRQRSPAALRALRARAGAAREAAAARRRGRRSRPRGAGRWRRSAAAPSRSRSTRRDAARSPRPRGWLLIRDFRQATRFTRPGRRRDRGARRARGGRDRRRPRPSPRSARTCSTPTRPGSSPTSTRREQADERGFDRRPRRERRARRAATGRSSPPSTRSSAGRRARAPPTATSPRSSARPPRGDARGVRRARETRSLERLDGFTAAPFTPEEQARRANQLTRFLDLVPIEYDRRHRRRRVTIPFELQEAVAFIEGAAVGVRRPGGDARRSATRRRSPTVEARARRARRLSPATPTRAARSSPLEEVEAAHDARQRRRSTRCSPRSGRSRHARPTST